MTSYERVMNRFEGKSVDRLPNFNLIMMFGAKQLGVTFGQYCSDYRLLADGACLCMKSTALICSAPFLIPCGRPRAWAPKS